jgi:hypothetical protein
MIKAGILLFFSSNTSVLYGWEMGVGFLPKTQFREHFTCFCYQGQLVF